MNDSKKISKQDWICNNPTEDEMRFNDDCEIISSDDSDSVNDNSSKPTKYNQLLPIGKSIHKLLHSVKPEINKIWKPVVIGRDNLNENTRDQTSLDSDGNVFSLDSSNEGSYRPSKDNIRSKSRSVGVDRSLNSGSRPTKGWMNRQTVESAVGLQENDSDSTVELQEDDSNFQVGTVSFKEMAKSKKRKLESSISCEEEASSSKKIKTDSVSKKVKLKEKSHNVSSSETEDSERNTDRIKKKRHEIVNKPTRNDLNSHLLSSESASEADLTHDFTSSKLVSRNSASKNGEARDNSGSFGNSDLESNHATDAVVSNNNTTVSKKPHRLPKFTHELQEEISKFSLLLDEDLIENNDIWILQCPTNMDCSALVNQRLSLGDNCQLNDDERTYEAYSYRNSHPKSATLAIPSERNKLNLRRIPICGSIIVEESVKGFNNVQPNDVVLEPPSQVQFPQNLRERHPILGIDFSKQPRTAERIAENPAKIKKHSKQLGESFNEYAVQPSEKSDDNIASTKSKKKKKKKHVDDDSFN